ncbi:hypothetical protein M087_4924 [Bacteroides fragilis str. S23 R14]|nr:hypothetical protein M087_4924 [Bacteroides fragilis str. S23 R14]EYA63808.1 hypothetical protein M139_4919 [Bacteroides fragilis str. S23L24]EYE41191.1 hypothetical protein M138_4857 [Bacteroides fragilis str. S23L17]
MEYKILLSFLEERASGLSYDYRAHTDSQVYNDPKKRERT